MSVTIEEINDGTYVRLNKDGYWALRAFNIAGLSGTTANFLVGGTFSLVSGGTMTLPTWGTQHNSIIGCACIEAEHKPWPQGSKTSARYIATYGPTDLINSWKITISGSNGYKDLTVDNSGKPYFIVKYPNPNPGGADLVDYGDASYLAPGSVVTFETDIYTPPMPIARAFKSRTNSAAFLGFPASQVLCRDIQAESFINGTRWHIRYIFEILYSALGWQQTFLFHDQITGRVPSDVSGTDGTKGILVADPYKIGVGQADFNSIGLPTVLVTG